MDWKVDEPVNHAGHKHHGWPQWLSALDVATRDVFPRFHQQGTRTTPYEPEVGADLKRTYPLVDRMSGADTTDRFSRLTADEQDDFVDDATERPADRDAKFQSDGVRRGDFKSPAARHTDAVDSS